jgi:FkbM family methyltransferase
MNILSKKIISRTRNLFLKNHLEKLKNDFSKESGIVFINNYEIKYIDARSFYYEYQDIFKYKIYHFIADKEAPTIIDLGGYIGMSTLYFKSIYPKAKITVFEPDKKSFSTLENNITINCLNDVNLINAGVGKKEEEAIFYGDDSDGNSIFNIDKKTQKNSIKIVKLSNFINEPIDFLKMNIEGMECDVFEEIEPKLKYIKEIIFEYHLFSGLSQTLGKILTILDRNGFRYIITDATSAKIPVPFSLKKDYKYFNLVYAKQW